MDPILKEHPYLIWKTIIGETLKFLSPLDKAVTQAYSVDYSHVTY